MRRLISASESVDPVDRVDLRKGQARMGMGTGPGLAQGGHDEERRKNEKAKSGSGNKKLQTLETKRHEGERKIAGPRIQRQRA